MLSMEKELNEIGITSPGLPLSTSILDRKSQSSYLFPLQNIG